MTVAEPSLKLPARWTILRDHKVQCAYRDSPHRFNTVHAGRRSGKTERFKRKLVRRALSATTTWEPRLFAAAPTRDQAKRIYWEDLKALVGRDMMLQKPSESDLMIKVLTGAEIWVIGLDRPERMEGQPWDGGGVDEIGNCKPTAWTQNIRPALSDRRGWCDFLGVPEGRNHYYDLDQNAHAQMVELGAKSDWGSYTWFSADILPPEEIAAAKRDLDELTYQQEYEGSFVSFEGRTYYVFNVSVHAAKPLRYDARKPLELCFDFNVEPGVAAVIQEQTLPGQYARAANGGTLLDQPIVGTGVISEVHIPRNSNTPAVCRKLVADFGTHQGFVRCYGDATGGARGSAKVQGSDWDLIERELRPVFKERLSFCVKSANPAERARINAVNSRLLSKSGEVKLLVDPARAPYTVKDLDGVQLLKGGSGEIDKAATPLLTHLTDAVGYYVEFRFPVRGQELLRVPLTGL